MLRKSGVVLDLRDQVDAVEDRRDVAGEVDAVVARQVEDVALAHDVVLAHVAGAQHVVEVDRDQGLRLVLMNQVNLLLGGVAREALGGADGVHDGVALVELEGAGLLGLAEDVDADGAELRDVDGDVRVDDVARKRGRDGIGELRDGHALGVDLADERERDIAIGAHGERRLVGGGIAEILLLGHDDTQLVTGAQQVVGRGRRGRGRRSGRCLRDETSFSLRDGRNGFAAHRSGRAAAARHLGGYLARVTRRCGCRGATAQGQAGREHEHGSLHHLALLVTIYHHIVVSQSNSRLKSPRFCACQWSGISG